VLIKIAKNYVYGIKFDKSSSHKPLVDALREANRYRNQLCELEIVRRRESESVMHLHAPRIAKIEFQLARVNAKIDACKQVLEQEKIRQRTKQPKGPVVKRANDRKKRLTQARKQITSVRKIIKADGYALASDDLKAVESSHSDRVKSAKSHAINVCGLYWGTEATVRASTGSMRSGAPPKFVPFDALGQLAVQLQAQKGKSIDVMKKNTLCYIEPDESGKIADCYIRIASDEKGKPIFYKSRIVFHRPLPGGSAVKWAYIERRRLGSKIKLRIRLTIEMLVPTPSPNKNNWVAIRPGYGEQSGSVRAAIAIGHDGERYSIEDSVIDLHQSHERLDSICSKIDSEIEVCKKAIAALLADEMPEVLAEKIKHFSKIKSPAAFAKLRALWNRERYDGDEDAYSTMRSIAAKVSELDHQRCRLAARMSRHRDNTYRNFVAKLRSKYEVAIVPDTVYSAHETDEENPYQAVEKTNRRRSNASPGTLRRFIEESFFCATIKVKSESNTCCQCGGEVTRKAGDVICSECGTMRADENSLGNLIASGEVAMKSGALLALRKSLEEKDQKAKDKLTKMQTANREKIAARKNAESALA
jgi:hypothetical protein